MEFTLINLSESWFDKLKLDELDLENRQIPTYPSWRCAINSNDRILFTQLISNMSEMRDGFYYYLLAIRDDLILVWICSEAKFVDKGALNNYKIDYLMSLVNDAYSILSQSNDLLFTSNQFKKIQNNIIKL